MSMTHYVYFVVKYTLPPAPRAAHHSQIGFVPLIPRPHHSPSRHLIFSLDRPTCDVTK